MGKYFRWGNNIGGNNIGGRNIIGGKFYRWGNIIGEEIILVGEML